jgi:hypothetical protein
MKKDYDMDTLKYIAEGGVPSYHMTYQQTVSFFDTYPYEVWEVVTQEISDWSEFGVMVGSSGPPSLNKLKNQCVWLAMQSIASSIVSE